MTTPVSTHPAAGMHPQIACLSLLFLLRVFTHAHPHEKGETKEIAPPTSLSDVELETGDEDDHDSSAESQHIFPSFSAIFPPLGHSRPAFFPESGRGYQVDTFRYTPRNNPASNLYTATSPEDESVLGSGNFGVIRGGTYYSGSGDEPAFLRGNNAHSRPYRRPNPPPLYRGGGDFFQGFRDFADITTPSKAAYSQYVVVYANRKGTGEMVGAPRNIIEQLELLEAEEKKSKGKRKLEAFQGKEKATELRKKSKKSPKEQLEPLIALS